jgi:uncharacterized sporulation protein YeaH/YhbH (DUF444 family)
MTEQRSDKESIARRTLMSQDRERQLNALKRDLIAAANGPSSELSMEEVRKKGLLAVLRKQARKKPVKPIDS